jgi:DNA invertase Pin-like site-specific DNA recombinase
VKVDRRKKLTAEKVGTIRQRHAAGASKCRLAKEYGVSRCCIRAIVRHQTWKT